MPKFNLTQTQALTELFAESRESRDQAWRKKFYTAVPDATLMAFEPQVSPGPDQFPYFHRAVPDPGCLTPYCVRREGLRGHEAERRPSHTDHQVLTAAPSEAYLPTRARKALAGYMRHWFEHPDPKITLLEDPQQSPSRSLMVSLTLDDYDGDAKLSRGHTLSLLVSAGYVLYCADAGRLDGL